MTVGFCGQLPTGLRLPPLGGWGEGGPFQIRMTLFRRNRNVSMTSHSRMIRRGPGPVCDATQNLSDTVAMAGACEEQHGRGLPQGVPAGTAPSPLPQFHCGLGRHLIFLAAPHHREVRTAQRLTICNGGLQIEALGRPRS